MNRKKSFNRPALWEHLLFLGPASIVFLIVIIIPFIISVGYSFTDWNGVSSNISFIGIKNFIDIFTGKSNFLGAFKFTFIIAICNVVCMNIAGIAIAALLTTKIPLQSAFRVVFYLPNIIGGLILGFVWQFIFINGVPAIGKLLHFGPLMTPWLGTEMTAYAAIVIVSVWQGMGYVMVIMIAALTGISSELVEAAKIDGANAFQIFFKIKLPLCMPYITLCLFWTISQAFKMFDLNYSLTKGGPYGSTVCDIYNHIDDLKALGRSEDFVDVEDIQFVNLEQDEESYRSCYSAYLNYEDVMNERINTGWYENRDISGTKYYLGKKYDVSTGKRIFTEKVKVIYTSDFTIDETSENVWVDKEAETEDGQVYIVNFL